MVKVSQLSAPLEAPADGEWYSFSTSERVDAPTGTEDLFIRVASGGNAATARFKRQFLAKHRRAFRDDKNRESLQDKEEVETIGRTFLIGWANLTGEDGVDIEYSPDAAVELLSGPAGGEILGAVYLALSANRSAETDAGNSEGGSDGS